MPVLIEYPKQRSEVELRDRLMPPLLHYPLLLKAQALHHVLLPPVIRQNGQFIGKKSSKLHGCESNKVVHTFTPLTFVLFTGSSLFVAIATSRP